MGLALLQSPLATELQPGKCLFADCLQHRGKLAVYTLPDWLFTGPLQAGRAHCPYITRLLPSAAEHHLAQATFDAAKHAMLVEETSHVSMRPGAAT